MKIEQLPVSRWSELREAYEECRSTDPLPLPKPEQSVILAALDGDRIVGCVGASRVWHASPLWVDKPFRGNGLPRQLVDEISKFNTEGLEQMIVTTSPHVERLVFDVGFIPVQGTIWRRDR